MQITRVKVGGVTKTPTFYRHNAVLEFGLGQATFGVVYQLKGWLQVTPKKATSSRKDVTVVDLDSPADVSE